MNAVIYARFSSYNQTERSIEGQLEDCMAYAERNGYRVVKSYIDRAKSGTDAEKRTDFQKMISDSASGQFDTVLVWKLDRFARNRYDSANYKHKLKKNGVKLHCVGIVPLLLWLFREYRLANGISLTAGAAAAARARVGVRHPYPCGTERCLFRGHQSG